MSGQNQLTLNTSSLHTGTVKFFMNDKGFGFVVSDKKIPGLPKKKDIFIHHTKGFNYARQQGQTVTFTRTGYIEVKDGSKVVFKVTKGNKGFLAEIWAVYQNGDISL